MTFAYQDYLFNSLLLPVFALVFLAVPVFQMIGRIIAQLVRGERAAFGDYRGVILFVLLILLGVLLVSSLFQGGIHLIYERADDAVTVSGTIEEIHKRSALSGTRYTSHGETSSGYDYTVNGVTCTGMALGTLEVGDEVTVTYMPKSGFVLAIEETAVAATGVLQGFFQDITNWQGAVVGTSYEQATNEISMDVTVKGNELTALATFVNPQMAPYSEAEKLGIASYQIVDANGKVVAAAAAESTEIVNGQAAVSIQLDGMDSGSYKLVVTAFVAEKKAEQPLNISGTWECAFIK